MESKVALISREFCYKNMHPFLQVIKYFQVFPEKISVHHVSNN